MALPDDALAALLGAIALAACRFTNGTPVIATFLLVTVGMLGLTRFKRSPALTYAGIASLAIAAHLALAASGIASAERHGLLTAVLALLLWLAGFACRRRTQASGE